MINQWMSDVVTGRRRHGRSSRRKKSVKAGVTSRSNRLAKMPAARHTTYRCLASKYTAQLLASATIWVGCSFSCVCESIADTHGIHVHPSGTIHIAFTVVFDLQAKRPKKPRRTYANSDVTSGCTFLSR